MGLITFKKMDIQKILELLTILEISILGNDGLWNLFNVGNGTKNLIHVLHI